MQPRNSHLSLTGIVVGSRVFSESGRFVDLLTKEYGRISLVARGARASKKRFAGALDLFISLDVEVSTKKHPWVLESAEIRNVRLGIRDNLEAFKRAQIVCEIVQACAHENMVLDGFYEAVERAFDLLTRHASFEAAGEYPKILKSLGIFPDLSVCKECGLEQPMALMESHGYIKPVCLSCENENVSRDAFAVLKGETCISSKSATRLEHFILDRLEEYLGRGLKTRRICAVL